MPGEAPAPASPSGASAEQPGPVEVALRRDLATFGELGEGTLGELALVLARAIDSQGLTKTELVKAADSLRIMLGQLREVAREHGDGGSGEEYSTPAWAGGATVRDPEEPGAADAGAEGGGGRAAAG